MRRSNARCAELVKACELVPNDLLRARYLEILQRGDVTATSIAQALHERGVKGLRRTRLDRGVNYATYDATRVERMLGISVLRDRRVTGVPLPREFLPYELAVKIAEVLGMDPLEAGV